MWPKSASALRRRVDVGRGDGIDDGVEGTEDGSWAGLGEGVGLGLGLLEGLADRIPPDVERAGDLPVAEAVAVRLLDCCEVIHRTHPSSLRPAGLEKPR